MYTHFQAILLKFYCEFLTIIVLLLSNCTLTSGQISDTTHYNVLCDSAKHYTDAVALQRNKPLILKAQKRESKRVIAALLCVALGPFGVHRLYLGTEPRVPAAYSVTLGGGLGFIPLIDFFVIVFSKDLNKYKRNNNVIMWAE